MQRLNLGLNYSTVFALTIVLLVVCFSNAIALPIAHNLVRSTDILTFAWVNKIIVPQVGNAIRLLAVPIFFGVLLASQVLGRKLSKRSIVTFGVTGLLLVSAFVVVTPAVNALIAHTGYYYLDTPLPLAAFYVGQYTNSTYFAINGSNWDNYLVHSNHTYVEEMTLGNTTSGMLYMSAVRHNYSLVIPSGVVVAEHFNETLRRFTSDVGSSPYTVCVDSVVSGYYLAEDCEENIFLVNTNASYVFEQVIAANTTVYATEGIYPISVLHPISVSNFHMLGSGWATEFSIAANAGFNITHTDSLYNIQFKDILFTGGSVADYCITSEMGVNKRISGLTVDHCRFQYFNKAGTITLDLENLEVSHITNNFFYRTRTAHIRFKADEYDMGNNQIMGNVFYTGYDVANENCIRFVTLEASAGNGGIGVTWSSDNQYYGEQSYGASSLAFNVTTVADDISSLHSYHDRFENIQMIKTTCNSSQEVVRKLIIRDAVVWANLPDMVLIDFDAFTRQCIVTDCNVEYFNATSPSEGTFVKDLGSTSATEYNAYYNNRFAGTANFTIGWQTHLADNYGAAIEAYYNVTSSGTDNLRNGNYFTLFSASNNNIGNGTTYTMRTNDAYIATSGGTIINITISDMDGNIIAVFTDDVTMVCVPFLWHVEIWYSVLPVLKIAWVP